MLNVVLGAWLALAVLVQFPGTRRWIHRLPLVRLLLAEFTLFAPGPRLADVRLKVRDAGVAGRGPRLLAAAPRRRSPLALVWNPGRLEYHRTKDICDTAQALSLPDGLQVAIRMPAFRRLCFAAQHVTPGGGERADLIFLCRPLWSPGRYERPVTWVLRSVPIGAGHAERPV